MKPSIELEGQLDEHPTAVRNKVECEYAIRRGMEMNDGSSQAGMDKMVA